MQCSLLSPFLSGFFYKKGCLHRHASILMVTTPGSPPATWYRGLPSLLRPSPPPSRMRDRSREPFCLLGTAGGGPGLWQAKRRAWLQPQQVRAQRGGQGRSGQSQTLNRLKISKLANHSCAKFHVIRVTVYKFYAKR